MSSPKGMYRRQGHHRAPSSVSQVTLKTCLLTLGPCKLAIVPVANGSAAQVVVAALAVPIPRRPVAVARCEALVVATDAVATFVPVLLPHCRQVQSFSFVAVQLDAQVRAHLATM